MLNVVRNRGIIWYCSVTYNTKLQKQILLSFEQISFQQTQAWDQIGLQFVERN